MNNVGTIFQAEAKNGMRKVWERMRTHPIFSAFFIFIFIASLQVIIMIGYRIYLLTLEGYDFYFEHGVIATVFGLLIAGKSGAIVYTKVLRRWDNTWFLSSSRPHEALFALLILEVSSTLALLLSGMALTLMLMALTGHPFLPPLEWVLEGALIGLTAILASFFVPIYLNIQGRLRHYAGMVVSWSFLASFFSFIRYAYPAVGRGVYYAGLMVFLTLALVLFLNASRYYLEAWGAQVARASGVHIFGGGVFTSLLQRSRSHLAAMAIKEIRTTLRERDALATMGISIFLGLALIYTYYNPEILSKALKINPTLVWSTAVVSTLFIALELQCNLMGAEALGMEGRRFYIYRSAPVGGRDIMLAKAISLAAVALPLTLFITIPVPIAASLNPALTADLVLMGISLTLCLTALGTYFGTRYPNFAEGEGGNPDIVTLLNISFMGMFTSVPVIAVIAYAYAYMPQAEMSLPIALDVVGWSMALFLWSAERAGRIVDRMEAHVYL